jgi:hypothetical protein
MHKAHYFQAISARITQILYQGRKEKISASAILGELLDFRRPKFDAEGGSCSVLAENNVRIYS